VHHFLRDLAKPMLEAESHAKGKMRRTGRGLRLIEREGLQQRRPSAPVAPAVAPAATPPVPHALAHQVAKDRAAATAPPAAASAVVLDDWSAVRGIRNDDQGGPFQPPG
jgi:hypothetical protein